MIRQFRNYILAVLLLVKLASPLVAESAADGAKTDAKSDSNSDAKSDSKSEEKFFEEPPLSVTAHTITVGGKTLKYHATAGFIVLKEEEGKPLVKDAAPKPSEAKSESKAQSEGLLRCLHP
jgi:carboxypeptidase C (cathepsin A)